MRAIFRGPLRKARCFRKTRPPGTSGFPAVLPRLRGWKRRRGEDEGAIDLAVQRILMGHALIAAFGGIPLIYMGDELAALNDYGYLDNPDHAHDSRWIHRPRMDWDAAAARDIG